MTDAYGEPIDYSVTGSHNNSNGVLVTRDAETHKLFTLDKTKQHSSKF